ncbi:sialidase family protein [Allorhodopirellula heiligendammensis]|uniref:exo-alpha-sialidase n=1 Tax=Allorhodopirellula heiligendammensis TaxID=2714739 RepID=A0A5C6C2N7_9BACT|nr:sialidase family protein [Allorhodopirellula heiligendammensis]TWU18743.1 Sialidase precursor [Allorhodopirellula heiligendammensis]
MITQKTLAVCLALCCGIACGQETSVPLDPVTVFRSGSDGYKVFRIPAIVTAANGDLLAFCEARQGGDASEIDLVLKRSSDQGKTWGGIEIVQPSDAFRSFYKDPSREISVGNPTPVVDHLDPEHAGRIWLPFTVENDRVFVTYSDDHGNTWAERVEVTDTVKKPEWGWYAPGPVHAIQLQRGLNKGRLVVPCDHRLGDDGADKGANGAHAILSDDHGKSWRIGAVDDTYEDDLHANETAVVELNDGRLYFNTRDQNGAARGSRGEAFSSDAGASFDPSSVSAYQFFQPSPEILDPPVVQCSLLRAASTLNGDAHDLILFSGPDENGPSGKGRSDLRVRFSTDETSTWQDGPLIYAGPAAYSDMVRLDAIRYGVLFEAGQRSPYESIVFVVVTQSQLMTNERAHDAQQP